MNATCGLTPARQSGAGRFKPEALRSLNERPPGRLGVQAVRAVRAGRQDSARPSPGGSSGPGTACGEATSLTADNHPYFAQSPHPVPSRPSADVCPRRSTDTNAGRGVGAASVACTRTRSPM